MDVKDIVFALKEFIVFAGQGERMFVEKIRNFIYSVLFSIFI